MEDQKITPLDKDNPVGNPMIIADRLIRNIPDPILFKVFEIITHYKGKSPREDNDGS